jgi:secreted trypsin-like serine protease
VSASASANDPFPFQFCAGVVTATHTVLTAAHCVDEATPDRIVVIVDADNLCRDRPIDGTRIAVTSIEIDPGYDPTTQARDLAILTLAEAAAGSAREIAVESLPEHAVTLGWGRGSIAGVPPCRLQRADLAMLDETACAAGIAASAGYAFVPDSMWCGVPAPGSRDSCSGDSGGPLILGNDVDRGPVIGIVSWGRGCGRGVPGAYARLDDWFSRRQTADGGGTR